MAYSINLKLAAERHFAAAETLHSSPRKDVAGYLYGLAAECAVKELMRRSGIFPASTDLTKKHDPYFAHFPELKTCLTNRLQGRNSMILHRIVSEQSFMQNWDIKMRYAPAKDINPKDVDRWRRQACQVLQDMQNN